jgi:hypothetical protein
MALQVQSLRANHCGADRHDQHSGAGDAHTPLDLPDTTQAERSGTAARSTIHGA